MTRAEVAQAAGVEEQAVSLWASRHPQSFPQPIREGRWLRYQVDAVAEWLDGRKIHQRARRADDPRDITYGQRFRSAAGLAAAPDVRARVNRSPGEPVQRLRAWADQLPVATDPVTFETVVLSLLCVRRVDPVGWSELQRASCAGIQAKVIEVTQRLPQQLTAATEKLRGLPTDWWPGQLSKLVQELSAAPMPAADAFDVLLDQFARRRHSSPDEYLVPAALARLMVRLVDPRPGQRVHDPCCGPGTLVVEAGRHLARIDESAVGDESIVLTGRATTERTWQLATLNTAVHGVRCDLGDGPPADVNEVDAGLGGYDVVLLNPPFGKAEWSVPASHPGWEWLCGRPAPYDTASAWLQAVAAALGPQGRAAVVMPSRFASGLSGQESAVRRGLVEHGFVRCVITLPRNLFRETALPVTVWILAHPGQAPREDILLIDARKATRDDRSYRMLTEAGCAAILHAHGRWLAGSAALSQGGSLVTAIAVTRDEVRDHEYALHHGAYQPRRPHLAASAVANQPVWPEVLDLRGSAPTGDQPDYRPAPGVETTMDSLVGAVPADWWVGPLWQRCEIQPGPSTTRFRDSDYLPDGVPVVMAGDIRDGGIKPDSRKRVSDRTVRRLQELYQLRRGDILLVRVGDTRRFGIVTENEAGWLMGDTCIRVRPGSGVTPEYLAWYLGRPQVQGWLEANTLYGSRSSISKRSLSQLPLALPPAATQQRIVVAGNRIDIWAPVVVCHDRQS
ncbi:N-6 DNA methylase [Micromonospora profundi]|uniref:N-6 DNA methylase n=1 Tax=Micromonospora profundi TaxID=1420889 RepID=UPI0038020F0D